MRALEPLSLRAGRALSGPQEATSIDGKTESTLSVWSLEAETGQGSDLEYRSFSRPPA